MKSANVEKWRAAHHAALETLAKSVGCNKPGLKLWRELSRLERKLYAVCYSYTCGPDNQNQHAATAEDWEKAKSDGREELTRIFGGNIPLGVFINGDPRGSMLKLDFEKVSIPEGMSKDWGQDGILAAQIN